MLYTELYNLSNCSASLEPEATASLKAFMLLAAAASLDRIVALISRTSEDMFLNRGIVSALFKVSKKFLTPSAEAESLSVSEPQAFSILYHAV